jgi:pimeloyl-ACP methyl ester carboxylesterase
MSAEASVLSRRFLLQTLAAVPAAAAFGGAALAATTSQTVAAATDDITPFKVSVPQSAIDDMKRRLKNTRWPEKETVSDWSQGVPLEKAKALVGHWAEKYDWRKFEKKLNAFPQFRTKIDGLGIHFIHVKSKHENALPMIMTHGWPGSVIEFLDIIGPLTDPTAHGGRAEDAFDVVIPSLPGFGWSDKPAETGWDTVRTGKAWGVLMQRLGYKKWVAQGGDWGAGVTHALGHIKPEGLVAAHVNWAFVFPEKLPDNPTPAEQKAIDGAKRFTTDGYGYFKEQMTRPQTIGYSLADSPVGLATFIYEKFQAWTDNKGNPEDALTVDQMLDDISIYWLTDTGASSARFYWENAKYAGFNAGHIDLPMAASMFPKEIFTVPKAWAEMYWSNIFYWNELEHGGHFAAFEQPEVFTEEMRKAFKSIRA